MLWESEVRCTCTRFSRRAHAAEALVVFDIYNKIATNQELLSRYLSSISKYVQCRNSKNSISVKMRYSPCQSATTITQI
jgi:hypothetical protein